jgi:hypothetical protein
MRECVCVCGGPPVITSHLVRVYARVRVRRTALASFPASAFIGTCRACACLRATYTRPDVRRTPRPPAARCRAPSRPPLLPPQIPLLRAFSGLLHSWLQPHYWEPSFRERARERCGAAPNPAHARPQHQPCRSQQHAHPTRFGLCLAPRTRASPLATRSYLRFLGLMAAYPTAQLVPAADIACVWHAHMGTGAPYRSDVTVPPLNGAAWTPSYLLLEAGARGGCLGRLYADGLRDKQ